MKVWIDQDQCIGNGICEELALAVFELRNGIAYVRDNDRLLPSGPTGAAWVPAECEDAVIEAAEACPGECIFIDVD